MKSETQLDWEEPPILVPPRSRLYRLEPIGLGTPMVECLSSYIHRLAEAHGVPTWVLVCRELAPLFRRKSILTSNGHCDLFGRLGMTINGDNDTALEATAILGELTGQTQLRSLTFCRLGSLVAEQRILRKSQAWCPACLEEWGKIGAPFYQPLIWTLSALKTCPTHSCHLGDSCPNCGRNHMPLGRYHWNGKCPRCSSWLGNALCDGSIHRTPLSEWWKFAAKTLERFMVDMQSLPDEVSQATFPLNVMDLIRSRFAGNYSGPARGLRVHRSTVFDWANGKRRPSLASLIALAHLFGEEAMDWIACRIDPGALHSTRTLEQSVAEFMRRPLRRYATETVRSHLTSVLQAAEFPPGSFAAACRQLGVNQTVAKRVCPDLAAEFMSRYRLCQTEGKRTREKFRRTAVESAVNQLLIEGRTLSYNQLGKVLPPTVSARDRLVRVEFKRLRKEAEDKMQVVMQDQVVSSR